MENQIEILVRVRKESVFKHTGKNWNQWILILEKAGARHWEFSQISSFLQTKFKLKPWWRLVVASGYETHIGKRVEGRNAKGLYSLTVSRSVPLSQKKAWQLLTSTHGQNLWLSAFVPVIFKAKNSFEVDGGIFGEVRTLKAPERLRLSWQESDWHKNSYLQLWVIARPGEKSILVFTHDNLPSARDRIRYRDYWKAAVDRISAELKVLIPESRPSGSRTAKKARR